MKTTLAATALITALSTPAFAFDITAMTEDERAMFRAEVRSYLLDNPEVIMEAVAALEAKQAAAQADAEKNMVAANAKMLFDDGYSWVGGNPDGDITVIEFSDYRCGYCRKAMKEVEELVESDGNIRFILKEFPILGEASLASSRFAIATLNVAGPEAYKAAHDALMAMNSEMTEPVLRRLAETLELDADAILAEMDSDKVTYAIEENRKLAQIFQINGTPTFIMGDELVRGYVPLNDMRMIVEDIRDNS